MKKLLLVITIVLFLFEEGYTQQWIDKKYSYDSLLNVPYGTAISFSGKLDTLQMDIYLPDCDDGSNTLKRPLLMWIHGGAFLAGDKNDPSIQYLCKQFAKRGYVTASIDYRLGYVSDEVAWNCNYPNYNCVFATDSAEWARAYYRAVQDGKGALRYLVNRHQPLRIDTANIFVAGESAGALAALGVALLDTISERPIQTYSISNAPLPSTNALNCAYNQGVTFGGSSVLRPDLGGIEGDIEPTSINYTIKGIGNMYGAMLANLLKDLPANKPKPAIYSFHQPCDLVVPFDSNYVYWGLSWCFTHGYNCYGIANNKIMLYGSNTFSHWNTVNNHGYVIQNDFTNVSFPYSFLLGAGSCTDQINYPCHAYDNRLLRENRLALFFSTKITTNPVCDTTTVTSLQELEGNDVNVFPNPIEDRLYIEGIQESDWKNVILLDMFGRALYPKKTIHERGLFIDMGRFSSGMYILQINQGNGILRNVKIVKP